MARLNRILVTGGAGYVGSALVPRLLGEGYVVNVLDLCLYGRGVLPKKDRRLTVIQGDIRDADAVAKAVEGCDAVIHLACISNDPSFELDPTLGKSINFDAFEPLVDASVKAGVKRFVYASSSSVYGISDATEVTEDHPLEPLTDYSKFKRDCEPILLSRASDDFAPIVIRPATVCGYAPRLRLDLTVNILTNHAVTNRKIKVFGGTQKRPNLHIGDMVDLYVKLMELPAERIRGKTFNAGYQNKAVREIARLVKETIEERQPDAPPIEIETTPTDDLRSYHISAQRIYEELGFVPERTIEDAVSDLVEAFADGRIKDSMTDDVYFNVKRMQRLEMK